MFVFADCLLSYIPYRLPKRFLTYVEGVTPLSSTRSVVVALASYLVIIFSIQAFLKNRQPQKLTTLFRIHNILLSSGSLIVFVLMMEEIMPFLWNHGLYHALCAENVWTPRMEFYYMINYYFKFWELFDTIFLALKKKPLQFLHVFHHSATVVLCFTQLNGRTRISWTVISLNLIVHVIMYYYYYATAGGAKLWWKKYLTSLQIAQFVIDLVLVYFATWQGLVFTYYRDSLPCVGNCAGSIPSALFGCALLTIYLGLFINFYLQTYKKPVRREKANGTTHKID